MVNATINPIKHDRPEGSHRFIAHVPFPEHHYRSFVNWSKRMKLQDQEGLLLEKRISECVCVCVRERFFVMESWKLRSPDLEKMERLFEKVFESRRGENGFYLTLYIFKYSQINGACFRNYYVLCFCVRKWKGGTSDIRNLLNLILVLSFIRIQKYEVWINFCFLSGI